jgi:hypothetical protein
MMNKETKALKRLYRREGVGPLKEWARKIATGSVDHWETRAAANWLLRKGAWPVRP